jgi:hypothetical protein
METTVLWAMPNSSDMSVVFHVCLVVLSGERGAIRGWIYINFKYTEQLHEAWTFSFHNLTSCYLFLILYETVRNEHKT